MNNLGHTDRKREEGLGQLESPGKPMDRFDKFDGLHLWRQFKSGREEALVYLYRTYVNVLYNYGCQFTNQKETVRDAVQEFFIELIRNRQNLSDTSSIKFYLFRSFRRKLVRVLKKENKFAKEELTEKPGFQISHNPEMRYIKDQLDVEQKKLLKEKFSCLPEKQREALLLYYYEGLSYEEIAKLFEMTRVKSARVLIYRAIDNLASELKVYRDMLLMLTLFYIC